MSLEKLAPNVFSFPEVAAPSTPPTGFVYIYAKSDGNLYQKDDAGTETSLAGGGSGAPVGATYIVQTADGTLTNEQALSSLSTGFMKVTTGTGVVSSIADPLPIGNGGTGQSAKAAAFNALSPLTTSGDLIMYDGSNNNVRFGIGADQKIIKSVGGNLSWVFPALNAIVAPTQLGSSQATITFSSIPADYQDLIIVVKGRSTSTIATVNVTFNADTGANYIRSYTTLSTAGASTDGRDTGLANITIQNAMPASTATTGYLGHLEMVIEAYAESAYTRTAWYKGVNHNNSTQLSTVTGSGSWNNVSNAISSIELNLSVGNFDTGTIYALYGRGTGA